MNYRHAYHAGNHTEVFKHSVLVLLIEHLLKKPRPFMVLDTHAGPGMYDLGSPEAQKTGEAAEGIGRIYTKSVPTVEPYLKIVHSFNRGRLRYYPGSPRIVQSLLRDQDRLIACELHDEDAALLRSNFRSDRRISVHHRDGYQTALAFVPPPERRGLVFIDPPFEAADEFDRLGRTLVSAIRKWPTGMFAAWYPIKNRSAARPFKRQLNGAKIGSLLSVEFLLFPEGDNRLAGSGMILSKPPWRFDEVLGALCSSLVGALKASHARWSVTRLSSEE
jgi:23S rRNA (adenine2030-N6)-methyltransferase